jgi:DNA recombination-dependent growth factor C
VIGQGDAILQAMSAASSEPRHLVKKKEKQQLKHEVFIDSAPYFFIKKKL